MDCRQTMEQKVIKQALQILTVKGGDGEVEGLGEGGGNTW